GTNARQGSTEIRTGVTGSDAAPTVDPRLFWCLSWGWCCGNGGAACLRVVTGRSVVRCLVLVAPRYVRERLAVVDLGLEGGDVLADGFADEVGEGGDPDVRATERERVVDPVFELGAEFDRHGPFTVVLLGCRRLS